jgi:hypothetical protein
MVFKNQDLNDSIKHTFIDFNDEITVKSRIEGIRIYKLEQKIPL